MSLTSKLIFGAFLLAVACMVPSYGFKGKGLVCRFVDTSTEAVINSTGCPFDNLDPPLFTCTNGSRTSDNNGRRRCRGYGRCDPPRPQPAVRKDYCRLDVPERCENDDDCPSSPGAVTSKCIEITFGRGPRRTTRKVCKIELSSLVKGMLAAQPCEIRARGNGGLIYSDLEECRNPKGFKFGRGNGRGNRGNNGNNQDEEERYVCEPDVNMRVDINNIRYSMRTCIPAPRNNPNNVGGPIEP